MPSSSLPIVPLRRVVLPGTSHEVRAFQEPYLSLVADLDERGLGVVLIRSGAEADGDWHAVGTQMRVEDRRDLGGGRVVLRAVGERRFAVRDMVAGPYPVACVDYLDEGESGKLASLHQRLRPLLRRYLATAAESGQGGNVMLDIAADPVALSYQVASVVRLSAPERQELLELPADARLHRELQMLPREIDLLERIMGSERT